MSRYVIILEDEPDLALVVRELLEDAGYQVTHVTTVEALLVEAARRAPCIALLDSTNPTTFDLWWLGPKLREMGVQSVAFTAHVSALTEFRADAHSFVGVLSKPFEADEFLEIVSAICWDDHQSAVS